MQGQQLLCFRNTKDRYSSNFHFDDFGQVFAAIDCCIVICNTVSFMNPCWCALGYVSTEIVFPLLNLALGPILQ